jgi:hypothetical protein
LVRSAFAIVKHHEIGVISLISYNYSPSLFYKVKDVIFECQVEARWREMIAVRNFILNSETPGLTIAETPALGVSQGPQHAGREPLRLN